MATKKLGKVFELKYDSTKVEEIAALVELAENVAPGTYLADVFNKTFVDWVSGQIENDFAPNVGEHFRSYEEDLAGANKKIAELAAELDKTKHYWEADAENLHREIDEQAARMNTVHEYLASATNRANSAEEALAKTQDKLASANDEIIRLKAKLYDLMEAK